MSESPARRYKEVVAGLAAAAEALRERDRERTAELTRRLGELDAEMLRTGERAALTRFGVELHWEAALEALWVESWMKLRPQPGPDRSAGPADRSADLGALDSAVEDTAAALQDAVRRGRFRLPRR